MFRADAKRRCFASWDGESRAGAALRLAGFSSGWRDCARGGCSAERCGSRAGAVFVLLRSCGSIGMFYVRLMPIVRFYWDVLCSFAPIIRSYRDVLCSITPAVCRIAPNRTACDMFRSYSAVGRDRLSTFSQRYAIIGLCKFISGLRVSLWRSRRGTKGRGNAGDAENGVGGAVWARFCVDILALPCFPRGVRWGCAPQTAPKSLRLSGLSSFDSRRGCVSRGEGHSGITKT